LLKPERLNDLEYSLIQEHVKASYELLNEVDIFKDLYNLVKYHHEHYDASGYPEGLKGEEIPLASQIMSFCDAFDAMTTDRIYKGHKNVQEALEEAKALRGKQFHPQVVDAACEVLQDIELSHISQIPKNKNEEERFSYFFKDQLTNCYNLSYLKFLALREDIQSYYAIHILSLHNFTQYNKIHGWDEGDEILKNIGDRVLNNHPGALVARVFGDDFVIAFKTPQKLQLDDLNIILKESQITLKHHIIDKSSFEIDKLEKIIRGLI